jgi:predicted RNA-binding Zn ribbon-like protein
MLEVIMKAMSDSFQLVAGNVALDFVNTLDNRYDPGHRLELLPSYERFVAFARQSGILTPAQGRRLLRQNGVAQRQSALARVIDLREALHFLFRSAAANERPPQAALETLNRLLSEVQLPHSIEWRKGTFYWLPADLVATLLAPLAPILEAAVALLTSPDVTHVRECGTRTCRWLFLDRSKNHTRRWCDMKICGNRAKAQRFYERQRDSV